MKFSDIQVNQWFQFEGDFFFKVEACIIDGDWVNAENVADESGWYFEDDDMVQPFNAKK